MSTLDLEAIEKRLAELNGNALAWAYSRETDELSDDFERLAGEAVPALVAEVKRLRALVAEEREACAREADRVATDIRLGRHPLAHGTELGRFAIPPDKVAHSVAAAIRARDT